MHSAGSLTISGGEIKNGVASQGGNIAVQAIGGKISNFAIGGGNVYGGVADAQNNANLYVNNTTMKLSGGTIDGGVTSVRTASGQAWVEISGNPEIKATGNTNLRLVGAGGATAPEVKIVGQLTGGEKTIGITAPVGTLVSCAASVALLRVRLLMTPLPIPSGVIPPWVSASGSLGMERPTLWRATSTSPAMLPIRSM